MDGSRERKRAAYVEQRRRKEGLQSFARLIVETKKHRIGSEKKRQMENKLKCLKVMI
jgi:hypothetical protein